MAKEILLYGGFFTFTAENYINNLNELDGEDVNMRMLTNGGDPEVSFGMISKWQEYPGKKTINVDGYARSTGAYFLCYSEFNECLDVSDFLFHRAAYAPYVERDPELFNEEARTDLKRINDHLRAALESKVDVPKFEQVTGFTLEQLFSTDGRIDVKLNATQAKKVGLIDKINPITPSIKKQVGANWDQSQLKISAEHSGEKPSFLADSTEPSIESTPQEKVTSNKNMDLHTLKTEHPSLYAQVIQEGKGLGITEGIKQENQRVSAYLVFADVDLNAVKEGIESAEAISPVQMAEFTRKTMSAEYLKKAEESTIEGVDTSAVEGKEKTEAAKKLATFEAEVKSNLGLNAE